MLLWICSFALSLVWLINGDNICTKSSYGTEFIFGFADLPYFTTRSESTDPSLSIRIVSKRSTYIYVTLPTTASASKTPTFVTNRHRVYQTGSFSFNATHINKNSVSSSRSSIKIRSNDPISVLAVYNVNSYVITNPILPVSSLSTSYVIPSYTQNSFSHSQSQMLIVALNDSTTVHIKSYDISNTQRLNANETYVYQPRQDLSGTSITSNYPVAVFSSVTMGYNSPYSSYTRVQTRDLFMQVPPIVKDALHFVVPSLPGVVKSYKVRIYATHIGARVEVHSSSSSKKLMHVYENIYYEYGTKGSTALEILSDNPIMVVQIALNSDGEAMYMTNIPAVSQYMTNYLTDSSHSFYIITVRYEEALGLLADGKPLMHNPEVAAHRTPLGNYTVFTVPMTTRDIVSHVGDEPFGLLVYGTFDVTRFGHFAYSYSAGMKFNEDCVYSTHASQIIG
ncbi:uncharacterized protein LOC123540887 [Mercenaria mercenaria]|uniref:uncharacterized protein LOC123540887 n=1 Tax=Mercenaria mercenaria TaxID=6596 RepID=UPI00234E9D1C|nr:uncharacterized protein LOC123540887 [Mercenaria mercenaria]